MVHSEFLEAFEIVNEIFDLPEGEREAALSARCAGRAALRAEVARIEAASSEADLPLCPQALLAAVLPSLGTDDAEEALAGTTVGPYLVEALLGSGGMSHVYRAVHTGHKGAVALKVMQFSSGRAAERVARLQHEASLLARCRHPGIVQIYHLDALPTGAGHFREGAYFSMELVDGTAITDFCARQRLPFGRRLELFLRVCEAVQAAHDVGVIHRDLKPSNILAHADGVKLLDFGIAEAFDEGHSSPRTYMSGAYAAPEHLQETSTRTDVYSLGVLLAELLLERLPFEITGTTAAEQRQSVLYGEHRPLRILAEEAVLPHLGHIGSLRWTEIEAIYRRATAVESSARYTAVNELAAEVRRLMLSRPVKACIATSRGAHGVYAGWRFLGRNALYVGIVAAAVVAGVGFQCKYTAALRRSRDAARGQQRAERQARLSADLATNMIFNDDGSMGQHRTTEALLEHAIHRAEIIHTDPEQLAGLYKTFGSDFEDLGNYARANELFGESLGLNAQVHGAESAEVAALLLKRSNLLSIAGSNREALTMARQARAMLVRKLPSSDLRVLEADDMIAECLTGLADYASAKQLLENVTRQEADDPAAVADYSTALNDLGVAENYLGDYGRSLELQKASMALDIVAEGPRHPDIGEHESSISNAYLLLGDNRDAEKAAREAVAILSASLPAGHHDVYAAKRQLATSLAREGNLAEADPLMQEVLAGLAKEPERSRTEVSALVEYGNLLRREGRLTDAIQAYQRSLAIDQMLYPTPNHMWAVAYHGIGAANYLLGATHEAEANARRALSLHQAAYGPDHVTVLQDEVLLAQILLQQGRAREVRTVLQAGLRTPVTNDSAMLQVHMEGNALLQQAEASGRGK